MQRMHWSDLIEAVAEQAQLCGVRRHWPTRGKVDSVEGAA
jgi:hypothetical protein